MKFQKNIVLWCLHFTGRGNGKCMVFLVLLTSFCKLFIRDKDGKYTTHTSFKYGSVHPSSILMFSTSFLKLLGQFGSN